MARKKSLLRQRKIARDTQVIFQVDHSDYGTITLRCGRGKSKLLLIIDNCLDGDVECVITRLPVPKTFNHWKARNRRRKVIQMGLAEFYDGMDCVPREETERLMKLIDLVVEAKQTFC